MDAERARLTEARVSKSAAWRKWGPYLSERQWGTVREDYSDGGDAWNYFTHDQARSRAYRWGEDGLAGISDDQQRLCFALALWNGRDPILKERLFGLNNSEGNHGEDVKEYYFYLDSTPTHSYMKYLYKYPQPPYPYSDLVDTNRHRGKHEFEYELIDTGVFDDNRYFDVFVEYAKASPEDILVQLTVDNRGPEPATLHALPTLWFRNTWSWGDAAPGAAAGRRRPRRQRDHGVPPRPRRTGPLRRGRGLAALHRERDQYPAPRRRGQPHALCQGWDQRLRGPRPGSVREPGEDGHEGLFVLHVRGARRRIPDRAPAAHGRGTGHERRRRRLRRRLRRRDAGAPIGGRRVLRLRRPVLIRQGCRQRDAPGARRHAVVQAVLPLRRRSVALGARRRPLQPAAASPPQRPLAPHAQCPHPVDARQVGVSLVRGLGPGLPRPCPESGRRELRQAAARPHAPRELPAPQRPAPRLRVELRRREPSCACLVHHLHLPAGEGPARARRPRLARARVPQAPAELHLVGEPQGSRRQQRLRGRLPRTRQHRRLRSQRAAADRRVPGAGGRHRLDGALLSEHARDHRRAGDGAAGLRGSGPQVRRALPLDRLGHDARRPERRDVGRGGRVLLRRPAAAGRQRSAPEGALHGRAAPAVRGDRVRRETHGEVPAAARANARLPHKAPGADGLHPQPRRARPRRPAARRG